MRKLVFADAHAHTSPEGLGAYKVASKFREHDGWFMALVMLPPWHYGVSLSPKSLVEGYSKAIEIFLGECSAAREAGIKVSCLAGFHPAEVDKLIGIGVKPEDVLALAEQVLEMEASLCSKGVIQGIGEVGRQHYKTMPERVAIATSIMIKAFEYARDYDCLVHLHLENAGYVTVRTVNDLARLVGVPPHLVVFHHASLRVAEAAENSGYYTTLPGKKELLSRAFSKNIPLDTLLIESDYIDDPKRPCVSSCPWEIIENELTLMREGVVNEETLFRINVDNIVKYYGVEPP